LAADGRFSDEELAEAWFDVDIVPGCLLVMRRGRSAVQKVLDQAILVGVGEYVGSCELEDRETEQSNLVLLR